MQWTSSIGQRLRLSGGSSGCQNDNYREKLIIAMSSGECPDMYTSWTGGPMIEYIESGFAQPLDDLFYKASPRTA